MCASLAFSIGAAVAAPTYVQAQAQLVRQRDGLGNVFAKLKAGKEVTIAYFGGSITAADGWRPKMTRWFRETYPTAKINEINAAIGGTGSDLGVYRAYQDVIRHKPDLVFVEFAVNDGGASPENIWRGMEGIVRQIWKADPNTDICYVYTLHAGMAGDYEKGLAPRSASSDEMLADYYGIPSINVALRTVQLAQEGKLIYSPKKDAEGKTEPTPEGVVLWSNDNVHPLDAGHNIYAEVIQTAMRQMENMSKNGPHALKPAFIEDNWEQAKMVGITPAMVTPGWKKLGAENDMAKRFANRLPELWHTNTPGDKLSFRFRGRAAKLYDLLGPDGGQVSVTLDGKASGPKPRFDSYSSYHRLGTLWLGDNLENTEHSVVVELLPTQPDRSSVTNVEKNKPNFDPKKYDGTNLWVGYILLLGDLVE